MNCTRINCELGRMGDGDTVRIMIHSRLSLRTVVEDITYDSQVSSVAVAEVLSVPNAHEFNMPLVTTAVSYCLLKGRRSARRGRLSARRGDGLLERGDCLLEGGDFLLEGGDCTLERRLSTRGGDFLLERRLSYS